MQEEMQLLEVLLLLLAVQVLQLQLMLHQQHILQEELGVIILLEVMVVQVVLIQGSEAKVLEE